MDTPTSPAAPEGYEPYPRELAAIHGAQEDMLEKPAGAQHEWIKSGLRPGSRMTPEVMHLMSFAVPLGTIGTYGIAHQSGPDGCREATEKGEIYCEEHLPYFRPWLPIAEYDREKHGEWVEGKDSDGDVLECRWAQHPLAKHPEFRWEDRDHCGMYTRRPTHFRPLPAPATEPGTVDGESLFRQWCDNSYVWDGMTNIERQRWNQLAAHIESERNAARARLAEVEGELAAVRRVLPQETNKVIQEADTLRARIASALTQLEAGSPDTADVARLREALKTIWDECEMGWIIQGTTDKIECGSCKGFATARERVQHDEGCLQGIIYNALARKETP